MRSRRSSAPEPPHPLPGVTTEHLKAAIDASVGPLKTELRWQRMVLGVLVAAVLGPRVSQLPAIAALSVDPNVGPHLVALARAYLGL